MKSIAILAAILLSPAILMPGATVKDQTIATWTVSDEDEGERLEYSLVVHSGVLESHEVEFCGSCPPKGIASSMSVKLDDVRRFSRDTLEGEEGVIPVQRIGITTRGEHDVTVTDSSGRTSTQSGTPGFAVFAIDQKQLRDEVYAKLCAMIGQKP